MVRDVRSTAIARSAEAVFLALSPALAFGAMHFPPIAQRGFVDPYIYTGYINNFEDLFQRYGVTYYGVRFGLLAPAELAANVLGPVGGYFALRYAYALLAGVPFYVLVRQRFGRPAAIAALSLLLTSPYFARVLLWDHPDASGVPLLFAAICCLLIEHRRRRLLDSCAAICAGLGVHSNVFVAAPLAVFVASYTFLSLLWRRGAFTPLAFLVSGAGVITALASGYYRWRVGVNDILSVTINTSLELANGGMAEWRTPGLDWVSREWHVLTPVALSFLALLVWSRGRVAFQETVMWTSATAVTTGFYIGQFLLGGNSLELFYYFSYLLPFVFLLLALIVGRLITGVPDSRLRWSASAVVVSAAIGPWVLRSLELEIVPPARFDHYLAAVGASAAVLILWRAAPRFRPVTLMCAVATLGLMLFSSFSTPVYARMIDSRVRTTPNEMDIYRVALQLIESVPRWSSDPGAVGFWYNETAESAIPSIQSTYLWQFSKVQGEGRGLPHLEAADLERLARMRVRWLVLLSETEGPLVLARETLRRLDIEHKQIGSRVLSSGTYALHFDLLELRLGSSSEPGQ
jgi:hypothetical protein